MTKYKNKSSIDLTKLEEALPHGSGIDSAWEFQVRKNGNVVCKNSFHAMDEYGGYDSYMPFNFTVYYDDINNRLVFNHLVCNESRRKSHLGLKDHLESIIDYALEEAGNTPLEAKETTQVG